MDKSLRVWNLNEILKGDSEVGSLDAAACVLKDAVELGPVDVQVGANRVGVSSMDGSIKIYDVNQSDSILEGSLLVDSNAMEGPAGDMQESLALDPWKFCFNPRNNSQMITGQLALQSCTISKGYIAATQQLPHSKYINCMEIAPSGELAATGDIDGQIRVINLHKMEQVGEPLSKHAKGVRSAAFTPDSTQLITGSDDLHIHMTDLQTRQSVLTLVSHADSITSISVNPMQPRYFVSASLDKSIKIWQQGHNKEVQTIALNDEVWSAKFSPDGRYIAVATKNGEISLVSFVN